MNGLIDHESILLLTIRLGHLHNKVNA